MAGAGVPVSSRGSRRARNDTAPIMEKVAPHPSAYMRHARKVPGYGQVVPAG